MAAVEKNGIDITGQDWESWYNSHKEILSEDKEPIPVIQQGKEMLYYKQASKKFKEFYLGEPNAKIPFNETAGWGDDNDSPGRDHWFEVDLEGIERELLQPTGKFFTTRAPQNVDHSMDENVPYVEGKAQTDLDEFKNKVLRHEITKAVILLEDNEFKKLGSENLIQFYEQVCDLKVLRYPIEDFTAPNDDEHFEQKVTKLEDLYCHLTLDLTIREENILVHCWGGSGRTGTVVSGILRLFQRDSPYQYARLYPGKSVYMDILEQEDWIEQQPFILNTDMVEENVELCMHLVIDHVTNLLKAVQENPEKKGILKSRYELSDETKKGLKRLYDTTRVKQIIGHMGSKEDALLNLHPDLREVERVFFHDVSYQEMCTLLRYNTRLKKDAEMETEH